VGPETQTVERKIAEKSGGFWAFVNCREKWENAGGRTEEVRSSPRGGRRSGARVVFCDGT